jgi:hypothetical protein
MGRLYTIIGLLLFLFVGYWLISHAFVIVRLTTAFGLMTFVALLAIIVISFKRLL